jgi:antitoxin VapB
LIYRGGIVSLNIKNDEAHRLAQELAELTGQSMTAAVTEALRERVARLRGSRQGSLADRLLAIGRDCAKRLPPEVRAIDHGALLYDERGLPR